MNMVTSTRRSDYANFGMAELMDHGTRYDRMEEFVDVCRLLWDSAEPDAMVWDRETGRVGDSAKVHDVRHQGKHFNVGGPLNTPPSPQGRPMLVQAGGSPRGIRASAYVADVVFGADMPLAMQVRQRKLLDEALVGLGKDPDGMGILWQTPICIAETDRDIAQPALMADAMDGTAGQARGKSRRIPAKQFHQRYIIKAIAHREVGLGTGLCVTIPRTHQLAIVTTVNPVADQWPQRLRNAALQFNGQIGNAAPCIQLIRRDNGLRRTDIDAALAGTAMIALRFIKGQRQIGINLAEKK
jgi:alkanesulfonate monooxygenase SsuD/methylene tetrahydromethanopterin reductase-like flavin-dependent oxidoreductase (luciferase family)